MINQLQNTISTYYKPSSSTTEFMKGKYFLRVLFTIMELEIIIPQHI